MRREWSAVLLFAVCTIIMASLSAGSIAWTRGPTLFGGGTQHRSTQARNAAPKAGILLCWCHVDWREASTPLVQWLHYRGGVAPAALIPRERDDSYSKQPSLSRRGEFWTSKKVPLASIFTTFLTLKWCFSWQKSIFMKENHYQERKKWSEIWLHQFNVFTLEYCSISVVFAKHGKPLKLDTSKYFMFLFWKCWRSRSYALEMSRRLRNFASKLILFRFHPSIVHISVETSWSILGCCIYNPGAAEGVSSGGGVSGRRRFFAATAGARCRSRLIAHCQICPAPRTSTIQGKRSLIFYISSLFWLMDLLSVRNNAKLCVDCTV